MRIEKSIATVSTSRADVPIRQYDAVVELLAATLYREHQAHARNRT